MSRAAPVPFDAAQDDPELVAASGTVRQWYNKARLSMPGTLFVVATPIGNLEDISARALRILREVSLIAAEDTRRTQHLLARYGIATPTTSLHEHNERRKTTFLIERLLRGDDIALVSDAGTPTVSDPGEQLLTAAIEASVRVEPIPGPSAALAALAVSGFPTETFTFLGFPPIRANDRSKWFEQLRTTRRTVIFFEAPHRIRQTLEQLLASVGDCDVCVARELTKAHEELVRGPISGVLPALGAPRGEFTVVVNLSESDNMPAIAAFSEEVAIREFCEMTKSGRLSRRQAIAQIARRHGRPPNEVYDVIERAKKLVQ
jgi:16S rRNA (cytidine1402-2'-O)-methyltransferase